MKKIAIYSGSFNPVTIAHIEAMKKISKNFHEVWVHPAVTHRQKSGLIDIKHRMIMAQLAIESTGCKNIKLSDVEINGNFEGKAFDIMEHIKQTNPKFEFYFVIGYDVVNSITSWYNYREFLEKNNFYIIPRKGVKPKMANIDLFYQQSKDVSIIISPNIPGFSSTQVRDLLSINYQKCNNGTCEINDEVRNLIPATVLQYITDNELYKVEPQLKQNIFTKLFKKLF